MSNLPPLHKGLLALFVGCVLNYLGGHLLGVQIELYRGLLGFGGLWVVDMFLLPFIVGFVVALICGVGGKWLSYFPPLIVRAISYYQVVHLSVLPQGATILPIGWWGFYVILVVEASAFGGILGEIIVKKNYGRSPRHMIYKDRSNAVESDSNK